MMSRKPFTPSRLLSPTEMNVVGTPVAMPIVYCVSRSWRDSVSSQLRARIIAPPAYSLDTSVGQLLRVLATIERLQRECGRR